MPHFTFDHPAQTDVRLDYSDHQADGLPVVLVHGFGCARADWQHQIDALSPTHRTITVDLPGHGTSTHEVADCRVEHLGAHIAGLLDHLALERAILVGHSMGCRVVMQGALDVPDRVAAVVLVDGSCIGQGDGATLEAEARAVFEKGGFAPTVRGLFADMFVDDAPNELEPDLIARAEALHPGLGTSLFASLVRWDAERIESALTDLDCDIAVIQSTHLNTDRKRVALAPGDTTPWLDLVRHQRPDARIELAFGVGHFTMLEAPSEVTSLIHAVAADLQRASS